MVGVKLRLAGMRTFYAKRCAKLHYADFTVAPGPRCRHIERLALRWSGDGLPCGGLVNRNMRQRLDPAEAVDQAAISHDHRNAKLHRTPQYTRSLIIIGSIGTPDQIGTSV